MNMHTYTIDLGFLPCLKHKRHPSPDLSEG